MLLMDVEWKGGGNPVVFPCIAQYKLQIQVPAWPAILYQKNKVFCAHFFMLILNPEKMKGKVLCQEPAKLVFYILHLSNVITLGNVCKIKFDEILHRKCHVMLSI